MGRPWVLDCDDADFLDLAMAPRLEATAKGALGVVCGSRFIRDWAVGLNAQAEVIWTGTPVSAAPPPDSGRAGRWWLGRRPRPWAILRSWPSCRR